MSVSGYRVEHRVSRKKKQSEAWYKPWADYIIGQIDTSSVEDIKDKIRAVRGEITDNYYKKVLNPFNATDKKFTRWRAEMRNYDIMRDVIRRYMGEYAKQPFDFQVKANDPEVITRFNDAFALKVSEMAVQEYINNLNQLGVTTGQPSAEVPDFQKFFEEFKEDYVDDLAAQGQDLLTAIIDWTESNLKYYTAFYNYIVLGQAYTYRDIRNDVLHKETIDPLSIFPISNGEPFVEDHNKVVRHFEVTMGQLLENFSTILSEKSYKRVKELYDNYQNSNGGVYVPMSFFKSLYDDKLYSTFSTDASVASRIGNDMYRFTNLDDMVDGYHITFTTEVKVYHLAYVDPITGTVQEEIIEADSFQMDPTKGHISLTSEWWNEVWEVYRFGNKWDNVYSVPRPIAYQRRDGNNPQKVKQPYNGLSEIIPRTGFTFSIPDAVLPYQIARNIFAFYREKIIAKNKDKVLVVPKSLMGDDQEAEDKIYRLEANSVFEYDDAEDDAGTKAQHIRILDASLSQFIAHITDLMDRMKQEAWDTVDMNPQRYGDIDTSAGKGTTQEAIVRSSMGSVIIFTMFEKFLEKEYTADLEYSKMAYSNGKAGAYTDLDGNTRFLDLDVEKHLLANYGLHVVSSAIQNDKRQALKDIAFAGAQNGEMGLAAKAVLADNVASIKKAFNEFEEAQKAYQQSIANEKEKIVQQTEQVKAQNDQANRDNQKEIAMMKEQGDTERAIINARVELAKLETTLNTAGEGADTSGTKSLIEQQKLYLDQLAQQNDMQKHRDTMQVKREEMRSKEKIAKENKNKYDAKK